MHRTSRGSGSGSGLLEQSQGRQPPPLRAPPPPPPPTTALPLAEYHDNDDDNDDDHHEEQKDAFPEFVPNGHAVAHAPDKKKEVIDAGLKSLDHCTPARLAARVLVVAHTDQSIP